MGRQCRTVVVILDQGSTGIRSRMLTCVSQAKAGPCDGSSASMASSELPHISDPSWMFQS